MSFQRYIRKMGGVARMAYPAIIEEIINAVTIPVMAKARIGHFVEAQILKALGVDMVDESEVLTPRTYSTSRRPNSPSPSSAVLGIW
jgi:pyridoxal biosynthesis lyase PdxS